jgi:adenine-specific DNA-methyltransferase
MPSELSGVDVLNLPEELQEAVQHGEVFTRRWVVETILDLVGYTADRDLATMVIMEPACGEGAFLTAIADRLSVSCRKYGRSLEDAADAVQAFDLLSWWRLVSVRMVGMVRRSRQWQKNGSLSATFSCSAR